MRAVAIAGAAAISRYGASWRGLARALIDGTPLPGVPAETPLANPKARNARKMMSRGAYLAAATLAELMREVSWSPEQREGAGYYLGVGASGGSLEDVSALLDASIVAGPTGEPEFSTVAFGEHGLAACNPLLAFQLMNNFTLAHGAIFEGIGGPNSALFSRGSGTTAALIEAVHAIASGDCDRAIAGGADSALHPVTMAELAREGFTAIGLDGSEGAALLALVRADPLDPTAERLAGPVVVCGYGIATGNGRPLSLAINQAWESALGTADAVDAVVVATCEPSATDVVTEWARNRFPRARLVDTAALGATLAAGPALGWITALDLIAAGHSRTVLVIDAGVDGDAGAVLVQRQGAA